ncbi:phytyl ester synthase 1, chloroplastic-like isoform X2 [Primulina eburnea]|uniref:phytyl ester synthase 1, chloroplastic-like isoform X2 n=1 Tax=Primulina eburnea TaxID=1245227 RepID=UPI003C6C281F
MPAMASTVKVLGTPNNIIHSRFPVHCLDFKKSFSQTNGMCSGVKEESKRASLDLGKSKRNLYSEGINEGEKDLKNDEKLEALWDDGFGTQSMKDYFDFAKELIRHDGGPPRWFTPLSCGPPLKHSPLLFFLPGIDGVGLGLIMHHISLGKVFHVRCMHIPVQDRTPFQELLEWVEEALKYEHSVSPNKPIYIVGDSFGGCLALAVAARNPQIDLVLILANPATSFDRSRLPLLLHLLETLSDELHAAVPYLLGLILVDPMKMVSVDINNPMLHPMQFFKQLVSNLDTVRMCLHDLAEVLPKETLIWRLKQLKQAAAYANSRLRAITAQVLVLASGKDDMLPSGEEAWRILRSIQNCEIRCFKDNRHNILMENGFNLLTIIKGTGTYRRAKNHDLVVDFLPPSLSEFRQLLENYRWYHSYTSPVMLSTMEDGTIVRGLSGVPTQGPVLLVGYHMLMGLEIFPLITEFLRERGIMVRGIAHPTLFSHLLEGETKEFSVCDFVRLYGALCVSPSNLFKLLGMKSHVLLYPGGAREALHRKGEEYKLFWPEEPEFVRMAARFGATIVPFGGIGEDDIAKVVLDYDDMMKVPFLGDKIRRDNQRYASFNVRDGMAGEVGNQPLHLPALLPKIPAGRLYYLFGKPIQIKGRYELLKDRQKARELYFQIKSEVETNLSYLLKKRHEDPYRSMIDRILYQGRAPGASIDQIPSFDL